MDFDLLRKLARSAQAGDESAYRDFLQSLYAYARAVVRSRIGAIADVDDIVQECLLGVHNSLHTYHPSRKIKPWVDAIIRYKVVDYFRTQSRRKEYAVGGDPGVTSSPPRAKEKVTDGPSGGEAWALVEQLPRPMREAITMTKQEGLSTREAAERLEISEVALRKRLSRAYRKLAGLYEKKYRTEDNE